MEDQKKACKACKELINLRASWCPQCNRPQSFLRAIFPPPLIAALVLFVGGYWYVSYATIKVFEEEFGDDFEEYSTSYDGNAIYDVDAFLRVSATTVQVREGKCGPCVMTLGTVSNSSDQAYTRAHFQVSYFDVTGRMIDVVTSQDYDLIIPPMSETMFRVSGSAGAPAESYDRAEVTITKVELDTSW